LLRTTVVARRWDSRTDVGPARKTSPKKLCAIRSGAATSGDEGSALAKYQPLRSISKARFSRPLGHSDPRAQEERRVRHRLVVRLTIAKEETRPEGPSSRRWAARLPGRDPAQPPTRAGDLLTTQARHSRRCGRSRSGNSSTSTFCQQYLDEERGDRHFCLRTEIFEMAPTQQPPPFEIRERALLRANASCTA